MPTILTSHISLLTSHMVGLGGLEPPTSRLSGVRSSQLSYRPVEIEGRMPDVGCRIVSNSWLVAPEPWDV